MAIIISPCLQGRISVSMQFVVARVNFKRCIKIAKGRNFG
ncbi:hypothetical protein CBM2589_P270008 [Cupriavidus taiwanensis]|uniref:Uncharacterized protein n=1 Tax=Cupriavidus taiwanensis TaxID=164546 RepID=A0A375CMY1_9BURK|nr:hypothetical protein CBM2589_P270008 [Cupriavidus taiwanensis]